MTAVAVSARPRRCADHIVEWLASVGIDRVFGIPGGAISPLYDALREAEAGLVMNQHEAMAVYAAMGRHHATGRLQAVAVTSGPGVLNTLTPVAAAWADEVPLLVLAGEVRTAWAGRGALQDGGARGLDVTTVFRPVVREVFTLTRPEEVLDVLVAAAACAMRHPRGPVLVRLPVDLLGATAEPTPPRLPAPLEAPAPDPAAVAQIAHDLRAARRPVIFAGIGARSAGVGELVTRLAYRLRAGVITDIEAKGLVDEREPLALGAFGVGARGGADRWLASGVDVLLTIGARLDDTATGGFSDRLRVGRFLQVDHDAGRLGRPWTPDVAVHADLQRTLEALLASVGHLPADEIVRRDAELRSVVHRPEAVPPADGPPFHPAAVVSALQDAFGARARFTADIGNHMLFATRWLVADSPETFRMSNGLGGMGSGVGLAIGLSSALRGDEVAVGICGDGGLLMVGNELATCARYGLPVVLVVFDNRQLGMIAHGMRRVYGQASCCEVPSVDVLRFAESMGVEAIDVKHLDDLHVVARLAGRRPLLVRVPVDPDVELVNPRDAGFVRAEADRA